MSSSIARNVVISSAFDVFGVKTALKQILPLFSFKIASSDTILSSIVYCSRATLAMSGAMFNLSFQYVFEMPAIKVFTSRPVGGKCFGSGSVDLRKIPLPGFLRHLAQHTADFLIAAVFEQAFHQFPAAGSVSSSSVVSVSIFVSGSRIFDLICSSVAAITRNSLAISMLNSLEFRQIGPCTAPLKVQWEYRRCPMRFFSIKCSSKSSGPSKLSRCTLYCSFFISDNQRHDYIQEIDDEAADGTDD